MADIARAGGVARNTCNNIFQDVFGKSPIEYLTEYRICAAMELLRKKAAVTDVAMSCGFNTASYFSKIFKENDIDRVVHFAAENRGYKLKKQNFITY